MQDPKPRVREKTPEEASALADTDVSRKPDEFIREIYKEAYNNQQDGHDQVSKVMAKFSALLVGLAEDHRKIHTSIRRLTWMIIFLTIALLAYTIFLYKDTHTLIQREQAAPTHEAQKP